MSHVQSKNKGAKYDLQRRGCFSLTTDLLACYIALINLSAARRGANFSNLLKMSKTLAI